MRKQKKQKVWSTPSPRYKRRPRPGQQLALEWAPLAPRTSERVLPEPQLNLLLELEPEEVLWRGRSLFFFSVILHVLLIAFIVLAPDMFRRGAEMMGIVVERKPAQEFTLLIPPDLLRKLNQPPPETNNLSDRNRRAQGKSPAIDPNGLRMPFSRGNTPLPELPGGKPEPPPAPPPPPPASSSPPGASAPANPAPPAPKQEESQQARLQLEDVRPPGGGPGQRLDLGTPGDAIQQMAHEAMRGRGSSSGAGASGPGDSAGQFNNLNPNFSTEGPIILSDTRGVDFGPYLARVVYAVRRNWYAVIPEAARLGQKGRVAVVFEILKDGSVPQLRLVGSSGLEPLDRAALAGIRASIPFPPLPDEFTGNHLVLQFNFLYNLGYIP